MIDALAAFYDRVAQDATMKALLGVKASGRARVYPDFPDEDLVAGDYPRVTYGLATAVFIGPTAGEAQVAADLWIWPTGANGGAAKMQAVDDQMLELLNGATVVGKASKGAAWTFGGARVFSREVGARDIPAEPGKPLRRRRIYELRVS